MHLENGSQFIVIHIVSFNPWSCSSLEYHPMQIWYLGKKRKKRKEKKHRVHFWFFMSTTLKCLHIAYTYMMQEKRSPCEDTPRALTVQTIGLRTSLLVAVNQGISCFHQVRVFQVRDLQ